MKRQKPRCEAVVAEFAWWSQQCLNDAERIVAVDGEEYWVCVEHGGVA